MSKRAILIAAAAAIAVAALAGGALAGGAAIANTNSDDDDAPLTGNTLAQASAAALKAAGGGKVSETEKEPEQGTTYEVEVTKPNGDTVEIGLDAAFNVVAVEGDEEDGGTDSDD